MAELPAGTVTFLFTDIEGSTGLLHDLGADAYAEALAEHRRAVRDAFHRHGGVEVDTQGDAFFYAFARASDAVAAAVEAQAAFADGPVRVRIGVHTGEPTTTADGYVGMDVHKGARIAAAGHGGQVLVSEQTARLLDGIPLHDLGEHRLKDLTAPQRLFQVGDGSFPPLKTLQQTNLPVQPTPLVGRERELAQAARLLAGNRLLTLVGPGGTGKTRLALQLAADTAERFDGGVWWVSLAALTDPDLVEPAIAQTVGAKNGAADHLRSQRALLLLDNFEHLVDAAPRVAELLRGAPEVKALVTSRTPLRVAGEQEYPVPPLPDDEAVALFTERARALKPGFQPDEHVAVICRRLDGLPLALELAAARVKVLPPAKLVDRVERALPILTGGARDAPDRQRTLRATIGWSYELLDDDEKRLFARLAAFAGSFSLEAAEDVCEATLDTLQSLVDKSLLRETDDGRFFFLETIHEYAAERFDASGEEDVVRRRHAEFFLALAESANLRADADGEQRHDLVARDQGNIRAALAWALARDEVELGLRLAIAPENWWVTTSPFEGYRWLSTFLERGDGRISGKLLADGFRACAGTTYIVGEYELGTSYIERSLDEYRRVGDERGIGHMLLRLGVEANRVGDGERARALATESLDIARRVGHRRGEPQALTVLASLEFQDGHPERGMELLEHGAQLAGEIGFTWWQAGMLGSLAARALELGRPEDAARWGREGLALARRIHDRQNLIEGLAVLATSEARLGRHDAAGRLWGAIEAEEARGRVGQWEHYRERHAAEVLARAGGDDFERARAEGARLTLDEAVEYALAEDA